MYLRLLVNAFNPRVLARFSTKNYLLHPYKKNYKKLKAEKIDALRQKYEAFIEDDRKRKERNEYILSQLDKMRTCNSLVQKNKLKPFKENAGMFQKVSESISDPVGFAVQQRRSFRISERPDRNHADNVGQTSFIQKLLSNFILIPKRVPESTVTKRTSVPDKNVDDTDWKAKYEILNILKNAEKRGSVAENTDLEEIEHYENRAQSFDTVENLEEDIFFEEMIEPSIKKRADNLELYPAKVGKDSKDDDITIPLDTQDSETINEIGHQKQEDHIKGNEKLVYDDENGLNPAHIYYPHEDIGKPLGDIPTETEDVEYPIEIINVNDFTPRENVILKDGENINPKIEQTAKKRPPDDLDATVVTATEKSQSTKEPMDKPPIKAIDFGESSDTVHHPSEPCAQIVTELVDGTDTKDIQDFETEQQIFYQNPDENPNPLEQPEDVFAPLVENFQDQEYYYVAPHETPESVHISEHEETSSPYDQSYAQQYMSAQAQEYAETPKVVTETNNQWDVQAVYDGQQTNKGQEQPYDSQQVYESQQHYEGQQQQFEGQQQYYEGQQQHFEGQQQHFEEQQQHYEGQQDTYKQNDIYENTHLQPEYTEAVYDAQNHLNLQYNQELYTAEELIDTTEQVESQLDKEEGYEPQHNILLENKEIIPEHKP